MQEVFLSDHHLAIVMDYCNGLDLATLIGERLQCGVRPRRFRLFVTLIISVVLSDTASGLVCVVWLLSAHL